MTPSLTERYRRLNDTHRRTLVFNLGSEAGFYSEFNNMVFAIVYCLKYGYRFVLYSDAAAFKVGSGWDDYFEPFCASTRHAIHRRINRRTRAPQSWKARLAWRAYRMLSGNTLTHELWNRFYSADFERERFDIAELGIHGSLRDAARRIVAAIYRFNPKTSDAIARLVAPLGLAPTYAALNVRRGDKDTEFRFVPIEGYLAKLESLSSLPDIFVFTDDFSVVEELRALRPAKRFHTLTLESERGYFHGQFATLPAEQRYADMVKMFAAIEVMAGAEVAVGTFTANPGIFLGLRMPEERFHSVQRASWYQFDMKDVSHDLHERFQGGLPGRPGNT